MGGRADEVRRVRKGPGQVTVSQVTNHHKELGFYFTMLKDEEDFTEEWHDSTQILKPL